jgi:hypothetical protein
MKFAMRLAAPLVFCLVSSSLALPQEKATKKDKKPEPDGAILSFHARQRHYDS